MATITTIQSSDTPSDSLGVINQNFENLNDDKIEADSTDTLTNKTIDADLNTITDLETDNFKASAKTGADLKFVTGTEGNADELPIWNSDGDLVSSGKSFVTSLDASSDDNDIPTGAAVVQYVNEQLSFGKEVFVPVLKHSADANVYSSNIGGYAAVQGDSGETMWFLFVVPADFTTLTSIELIMVPDTTETLQLDIDVDISADGEAYNTHSVTVSNTTKSVTQNRMTRWRIDNLTGTPFASMLAGDVVGVKITSDTTLFRMLGMHIKYA